MSGFGDTLRHARANKGVTLTEAERAIRIPRKYLRALEDEDFGELPEGVYSRGIVRNYAQYLNLDPDDAIAYFEELRGSISGAFKVVPAVKPMEVPSHWAPNFALIAFMVVISAVLFAWLYSAFFAARDVLPTVTPGQPTPTTVDTTAVILALTPTATPTPQPTATPAPPTATPSPLPPTPTPPPARQAQQQAAVQQPAQQQAPTPRPAPRPTPTPTPDTSETHVVTVQAQELAWVQIVADGEVEYAGNLAPGKQVTVSGGVIVVESGNATNVFLWVDGEAYGLISKTQPVASVSIP